LSTLDYKYCIWKRSNESEFPQLDIYGSYFWLITSSSMHNYKYCIWKKNWWDQGSTIRYLWFVYLAKNLDFYAHLQILHLKKKQWEQFSTITYL
jgi:hypothetical protein